MTDAPERSKGLSPELSVVIPAHNEVENLHSLLDEITTALDGRIAYEVVVVDDHSDDGTDTLLQERAAADPRLRPVRHHRQAGQSAGLVTGVRWARGAWVATLDGDGQNDPADIPGLLDARSNDPGIGLIAGHRVKRNDPWTKRLSSRIANAVRASLLGDATPDTGCGLKLFRRDLFLRLPPFRNMHRFLPALVQREGLRSKSVPVHHRPRNMGRSHYGVGNRLFVGIIDILGVRWLQQRKLAPGDLLDLTTDDKRG